MRETRAATIFLFCFLTFLDRKHLRVGDDDDSNKSMDDGNDSNKSMDDDNGDDDVNVNDGVADESDDAMTSTDTRDDRKQDSFAPRSRK